MTTEKTMHEVQKQGQVNTQMVVQAKRITALEDVVVRFVDRLEQITTQSPPAGVSTKEEDGGLVSLALELKSNNSRIEHAVDELSDVLGRIEL